MKRIINPQTIEQVYEAVMCEAKYYEDLRAKENGENITTNSLMASFYLVAQWLENTKEINPERR